MGVSRTQVQDFALSKRPEVGEIIVNKGTVLVGTSDGYLDLLKLRADLDAVMEVLESEDFKLLLGWFKGARATLRSLGLTDTDLSTSVF